MEVTTRADYYRRIATLFNDLAQFEDVTETLDAASVTETTQRVTANILVPSPTTIIKNVQRVSAPPEVAEKMGRRLPPRDVVDDPEDPPPPAVANIVPTRCPRCGGNILDQRGMTFPSGKAMPAYQCANWRRDKGECRWIMWEDPGPAAPVNGVPVNAAGRVAGPPPKPSPLANDRAMARNAQTDFEDFPGALEDKDDSELPFSGA